MYTMMMLRQKPEYKDIKRANMDYNKYKNMQLNLLQNLKRELELKQVKPLSIERRNKLLQYRDKLSYQNEIDRIRGQLDDVRFPIASVERLRQRRVFLEKLIEKMGQ